MDANVYRRVMDDYLAGERALERDASPLEARGRREYDKLRSHYDRVSATLEQARNQKEELEFRHAVGELDATQLIERLRQPESVVARCLTAIAALDACKSRFLEAFREEELDGPVPSGLEPLPPAEARLPIEAAPPESAPRSAAPAAPLRRARAKAAEVEPPGVTAQAASSGEPNECDDQTFMLPDAMIINDEAEIPAFEFRLSAMNYVGRSEDNQIRLRRPGISRKHALIIANRSGFVIKDLESQNGTFVNGERVVERRLADGDQITMGDARLVFRVLTSGL